MTNAQLKRLLKLPLREVRAHFASQRPIGSGCYRIVYRVGKWAVKIPHHHTHYKDESHSKREIRILQSIRSLHLPRLLYGNLRTGVLAMEFLAKHPSSAGRDSWDKERVVALLRSQMKRKGLRPYQEGADDIWWGQTGRDSRGRVKLYDLGLL